MKEKPPDCVYKIRRLSDGLYSKGGTTPHFSKKGKVWTSLGALNGHLTLVADGGRYIPESQREAVRKTKLQQTYGGCEIVTYVVSTLEKATMPVISLERKTKPKGTSSMGPGVSSHRCSHCGLPTQTNMLGGPG